MKNTLALSAAAVALLLGSGLTAPPAEAAYVVDLTQVGANVVATGSGALDLSGLTPDGLFFVGPVLEPSAGIIGTGVSNLANVLSGVTGPANFGSGGIAAPSSGSGDNVGIPDPSFLFVPDTYISDGPLSDTSIYNNQTFTSLGVTPGTYVWTWGTGAHADSFTLQIGPTVPEPSTWALMTLGFVGLGIAGWRSRRQSVSAAA
jgi:hypothetical protein